jgi:hypothetical protein
MCNALKAVTEFGTFLATTIGIVFVYFQIKKLKQSIYSNTHSKLCDQSLELIRFLAEKPETYDYFYKGKALEENHKDRVFILYAYEALAIF